MAACGQLGDQRLEVVDLAVVHHADGSVFVEQRLNAAGEIDDGETAMPEANPGCVVKTLAVRPAMANGIGHPVEQGAIDLRVAATVKNASNSAHSIDPSNPRFRRRKRPPILRYHPRTRRLPDPKACCRVEQR